MKEAFAYMIGLGAALDFASAIWCWLIYHLTVSFKWIGAIGAGLLALGMCVVNFIRIRKMSGCESVETRDGNF